MSVTGHVVVVRDEPIEGVPSYRCYGPVSEAAVAREVATSLRDRGCWAEAMPLRALSEVMLELDSEDRRSSGSDA